eukprot:1792479-Rhodomonas_salina.2
MALPSRFSPPARPTSILAWKSALMVAQLGSGKSKGPPQARRQYRWPERLPVQPVAAGPGRPCLLASGLPLRRRTS